MRQGNATCPSGGLVALVEPRRVDELVGVRAAGAVETYRVYAYLRDDDETAGRAAMAATVDRIISDVYPVCTQETSDEENHR
jgi:hypothetical protein